MCYNLPQGFITFCKAKVKESIVDTAESLYTCASVINGAVDEGMLRQIVSRNEIPSGALLIPPKNTQIKFPFKVKYTHFLLSLFLTFMRTHTPLSTANSANSAELPESQSALQLPPTSSKPAITNSQSLLCMPT